MLNADLPPQLASQCNELVDRLRLIASNHACVGEFEVRETAKMLQKTIIVVDETGRTIGSYNRPDTYQGDISNFICIRFVHSTGPVGHYEAIVMRKDSSDEEDNLPVYVAARDIQPLPRKSPTTQNRKRRCKSATLLTASPHKNLLLSQKAKKRPQDNKQER